MTTKPETLAAAMAKAFAEIEGATKSAPGQVGHQRYKYADLTSVIEAIKPALVNHGLFFTQQPRVNDNGVEIETVLHHCGGETFSLGCLFVPADKRNAQGFGSALTYARRYALVTAFGVPVEDDDGKAASAPAPEQPAKPVQTPVITEAQLTELQMMFTHLGIPVAKFLAVAKVPNLAQLPAAWFDRAKKWINDESAAKRNVHDDTLADDAAFLGEGA